MSYARTAVTRMTLDMSRPDLQRSETVTLGDTNRRWEVTLINGGAPFRLPPNWTAALTGIKPDGTGLLNGCSVADGKIIYDFAAGAEIATCAGNYPVQFDIWDEVGDLVASPKLYVNVLEDVRPREGIKSDSEYGLLGEFIAQKNELISDVISNTTQIGDLIGRVKQNDEDIDLLGKTALDQGDDIAALKEKITTAGSVTIPTEEWSDDTPRTARFKIDGFGNGMTALLYPSDEETRKEASRVKLSAHPRLYMGTEGSQVEVVVSSAEVVPTKALYIDYIVIKTDNTDALPRVALIGVDAYGEGGGGTGSGVDEDAVKKIINSMLGNVANVRQYSADNPPPYPVTSVNSKTGAVTLSIPSKASDINAEEAGAVSTHNADQTAHPYLSGRVATALDRISGHDANIEEINTSVAERLKTADLAAKLDAYKAAQGLVSKTTTDLTNYYIKDEVYTKNEVAALISAIPKFEIKVVTSLPTVNISLTTVYLVKDTNEGGGLYTEYIYVNGAWEELGSQSLDLSGYVTDEELDNLLKSYATLTKVSELIADALKPYATEEETTEAIRVATVNLVTGAHVTAAINNALNAYYTSAQVDAKIAAQIKTALSPYILKEEAASTYATKDELSSVSLLPYGHSATWLEQNGDPAQLYQIDGYVWGYVSGSGWVKSDIQFLVVASEGDMTNKGGTPYLLRDGDSGTVYAYREESGDKGIEEVATLPDGTAYNGMIVGHNGKKKQATVTYDKVLADGVDNLAVISVGSISSVGNDLADERYRRSDRIELINPSTSTIYIEGLGDGKSGYIYFYKNGSSTAAERRDLTSTDWFTPTYDSATGILKIVMNHTFSSGTWEFRVYGTPASGYEGNGGDKDIVITVNEAISYVDKKAVTWTEIGTFTPYDPGGWDATDETYPIIDSLDADSDDSVAAVYSGDGYLYSNRLESGWMQSSRYDSILIDSQLSLTSKNAVQNRVVANELESIKLRAANADTKIAEVDSKVAAIVSGGGVAAIPEEWVDAVNTCIASIKSRQVGRNCVTFPFFSDNHQRNGYAGILIAHIMRECSIPYAFFGGDAISNGRASSAVKDGTATVEQEMIAQDKAFDNAMAYIPRGRFCRALGNHDGYLLPYKDPETGTVYGETVSYDRSQVYELFLRAEGVEQTKHFGGDGTYYYVDDLPSKVRWIILNTNGIGNTNIDPTQLAWLQSTALHVGEDGWGVVIISHCPIANVYEQSNIGNAAEVIAIVNANTDQQGADGKPAMIGWFSGHVHRDRIYTDLYTGGTGTSPGTVVSPLGFTQVTITSDHTAIAYKDDDGTDSDTKHPIDESDQSHAIDFVTVNKQTGEVYITRLGVGESRSYTYK